MLTPGSTTHGGKTLSKVFTDDGQLMEGQYVEVTLHKILD